MSANNEVQVQESTNKAPVGICNMEAVNRVSKLPVVESTLQTATNIYAKVKDYNSVTNWTLSTAESTVNKAIEVGKPLAVPVVSQLGGPIKKVDDILCSGLDYVETKVPAVKLPPGEMYTNTKDYVNNTVTPAVQHARDVVEPAVQAAKNAVEPAVQAAKQAVEPAMQAARQAVEPAVQSARQIAEPLMQPALEKACALKDYGTQKVEEFLHLNQDAEVLECADCQDTAEKKGPKSSPDY